MAKLAVAEPADGVYNWTATDYDINAAIDQGFNVYVTIQSAPAWVHGGKLTYHWGQCGGESGVFDPNAPDCGSAGSPNEYAPFDPPGPGRPQSFYWRRFVERAVQRYGDRVKYWGFWNEPTLQWFWPEWHEAPCYDRGKQLVDKVLKPGREAALAANPSVVIVGPEENIPGSVNHFLRLERDGFSGACTAPPYGRLFDILSIHAYSWHAGGTGISGALNEFGSAIAGFYRRPIWVTETNGDVHAATALNEFRMRGWVSKVFIYAMRSPTCFGLLDSNKDPCPTYSVVQSFITNNSPSMHLAGTTTAAGHDDYVLIQNPTSFPTTASVQFSTPTGSHFSIPVPVAAQSRATVSLNVSGHSGTEQAVSVTSSTPYLPLWAEHADYWNALEAGRASQGVGERNDTWYFAEGIVHGEFGWTEDVTVYNPSPDTSVNVTWQFLNVGGTGPSVSHVIAPGGSRRVRVNDFYPGVTEHSTVVSGRWSGGSHADQPAPIVAERTISWNNGLEAHSSRGVPYPDVAWYFAEGSTENGWSTYLLLMNPNSIPATVEVRYMLPTGPSEPFLHTVPANSRYTVAPPFLTSFGIIVKSVGANPVPIIAERTMYLGSNWTVGHAGEGATAPSQRWLFPEGSTCGDRFFDTYILLANPSTQLAQVKVVFMRQDGMAVNVTLVLLAGQRTNIVPWDYPSLRNQSFSTEVIVEKVDGQDVPPGIIAERAIYWDGRFGVASWFGGHVALGTP